CASRSAWNMSGICSRASTGVSRLFEGRGKEGRGTVTHEYDDPISPEAVAQAAQAVVERQVAEGRPVRDIASEVVAERFCSCVAEAGRADNAAILEALVRDVAERAEGMLAARQLLN